MSWKRSFEKLAEEFALAKRKKAALNTLLESGKISQSTYDVFCAELDDGVAEIERQQKALREKMDAKIRELGAQVKTLEMLLANFEIQHVAGEVDDEVYQREIGILSVGLDTARQELDAVKDAVGRLSSGEALPSVAVAQSVEEPKPKVDVAEESVTVVEVAESSEVVEKVQEVTENKEVQQAELKVDEGIKEETSG